MKTNTSKQGIKPENLHNLDDNTWLVNGFMEEVRKEKCTRIYTKCD